MIFTDNKLTENLVNVRFYNYSDPNMGWGDAGTALYATLPLSAFNETEKEGASGTYYTYTINDEWYNKLKKTFESDYWHMTTGYELENKEKREEEIKAAKAALEAAEYNLSFV